MLTRFALMWCITILNYLLQGIQNVMLVICFFMQYKKKKILYAEFGYEKTRTGRAGKN